MQKIRKKSLLRFPDMALTKFHIFGPIWPRSLFGVTWMDKKAKKSYEVMFIWSCTIHVHIKIIYLIIFYLHLWFVGPGKWNLDNNLYFWDTLLGVLLWKVEILGFWFFGYRKSSWVTTTPENFSFHTHFVLKISHWKYSSANVDSLSKPEFR